MWKDLIKISWAETANVWKHGETTYGKVLVLDSLLNHCKAAERAWGDKVEGWKDKRENTRKSEWPGEGFSGRAEYRNSLQDIRDNCFVWKEPTAEEIPALCHYKL